MITEREKKCLPCLEYRTRECKADGCKTCINQGTRRCFGCKFDTNSNRIIIHGSCNYYRRKES